MFEILKDKETIDEFILRLNKEFNTNVLLETKAFHIAIYPPYGGMWCTEFNIKLNNKKIFVGSDYAHSKEDIKNNIYKEVLKYIETKGDKK